MAYCMRMWWLVYVVILCSGKAFATEPPIYLGMSAAFSGPSRALGIELYRGAMSYLEKVNAQGGVNGHKIIIVPYDDGYDPLPTITNTIRFVEQDDIFALFSYVGTPTVARILPLLRKYSDRNIRLLFPFTGAQPHRKPPYDAYVCNFRASYQQEAEALVSLFLRMGRKRIAVFYQVDAYGRDGWNGVRKVLSKHGMRLTVDAAYRRGAEKQSDFALQAKRVTQSGADAVICVGTAAACASFIYEFRKIDEFSPVATLSFADSSELMRLLAFWENKKGGSCRGRVICTQVVPALTQRTPLMQEYRASMDAMTTAVPDHLLKRPYEKRQYSPVSLEGYLNARLLVEIMRNLGDEPQRKDLPAALAAVKNVDIGVGHPVSLSFGGRAAMKEVYILSAENGQPLSDDVVAGWQK